MFLVSLLNRPCKVLLRVSEGVREEFFVSRGMERMGFFFSSYFLFFFFDRGPLRGPLARRSSSLAEESSGLKRDVRTGEIFMEKGILI